MRRDRIFAVFLRFLVGDVTMNRTKYQYKSDYCEYFRANKLDVLVSSSAEGVVD
jgi:hypothetical protein